MNYLQLQFVMPLKIRALTAFLCEAGWRIRNKVIDNELIDNG
jgi:hypothetical protein